MSASTSRVRTVAAAVTGVVAAVAIVLSIVGWWAVAVVFDEDQVADIAVDTVRDPKVVDAVARSIVDDALTLLGAGEVFGEAERDAFAAELADLLSQPVVGDVVHQVVVAAHQGAMHVLADGELVAGVSVQGDAVVVNVLPLWATVLELATDIDLPPFLVEGDPAEQIAMIEGVLGVDLGDDAGQVVLFRSDTLEEVGGWVDLVRAILIALEALALLATVVAVIGAALTLLLARHRRRAGAVLATGVLAGCLAMMFIASRVVNGSTAVVSDPALAAVIHGSIEQAAAHLTRRLWLIDALMVVLAAVLMVLHRRSRPSPAPVGAG